MYIYLSVFVKKICLSLGGHMLMMADETRILTWLKHPLADASEDFKPVFMF